MKNRNYREVQFSSPQLVFIFVGILVLGVVIFLLGVSVGKKQAQIVKKTEIPVTAAAEKPKEASLPSPAPEAKDLISKELASHQKALEETQKKAPLVQKKDLFYIQVGAFDTKEGASSFAKEFEKRGYSVVVLDPFPSDKKPFYRVRIGGFETLEKAEEAKARLKSEAKGKVDYFITKR